MPEQLDHSIKFRKPGQKVFRFMTPRGGSNRLRIHAALFTREQGYKTIAQLQSDNPGHEFKFVRLYPQPA